MREIKFRAWDKEFKKWSETPLDYKIKSINYYTDYEWCQYTGLKDKNGTEVYEGDIVKCSRGCPHEVVWVQEHGGTFIGGMPAFYLSQTRAGYAWTNREEVIGNIYENPELLEDTHAE